MATAAGVVPPAGLLEPLVLAGLDNMTLVARAVLAGAGIGVHRSSGYGFGHEFAEYRAYEPGDDLRLMDWNVLGRSDRTYIKRFFGDTNLPVMVALDASASMEFPRDNASAVTKLDYGRFLAATFIYLASRQQDPVGLATYTDDVQSFLVPTSRRDRIQGLYHVLEQLKVEQPAVQGEDSRMHRTPPPMAAPAEAPVESAISAAPLVALVSRLGERLRRRTLVVIVSDFYVETQTLARQFRLLRGQGHELLLIQVLEPGELEVGRNAQGVSIFEDAETGATVQVSGEDLSDGYPSRLAAHRAALAEGARAAGGDFLSLSSDEPLARPVRDYLQFRMRR